MLIKSLELNNIRSYTDGMVKFPQGTTLLSGDIGCGKSTLLQAIEFAIFGAKKGDLSGYDLLRHGKNSGHVRLTFDLDGSEISVERTLKRSRDSVAQDTCTLRANGSSQTMTALELKSRMLDMFGYSQDMLKKNNPIFRYTVYTPQESMKHIMFDGDQRLATLRAIFGVDKYGAIRNNTKIFVTELRAMKRELDAAAVGADADMQKIGELLDQKKHAGYNVFDEKMKMQDVDKKIMSETAKLEAMKNDMHDLARKKQELAKKETEIRIKETRLGNITGEIISCEDKIASIRPDVDNKPDASISELKLKIIECDSKRDSLVSERAVLTKDIRNLEPVYEKGVCSVCSQAVWDREEFKKHIEERKERLKDIETEMKYADTASTKARESVASAERHKHIAAAHEDLVKRLACMSAEKDQLDSDVATLGMEIDNMKPGMERYDNIAAEIREQENTIRETTTEKIVIEKKITKLDEQIRNFESHISDLKSRLDQKDAARKKSQRVSDIINWFDQFVSLMETMEKHVMTAIQKEFDQYFGKWFGLVMGEQLSVRIDEKFTPRIQQNGYETEYENLSGGEKTSVALAYRLALNRVINNMVDNIKTKDLLILDEPTDGFSSEQLDKLRDVINELKLRQIIIVSHEQKIDTYVENVIRIFKENHVSRIAG